MSLLPETFWLACVHCEGTGEREPGGALCLFCNGAGEVFDYAAYNAETDGDTKET